MSVKIENGNSGQHEIVKDLWNHSKSGEDDRKRLKTKDDSFRFGIWWNTHSTENQLGGVKNKYRKTS